MSAAISGVFALAIYPHVAALMRATYLQDWIGVDGRHEKIHAGMRVSAEVKTGDRRVIEYLLSPVMQAVKEAWRER